MSHSSVVVKGLVGEFGDSEGNAIGSATVRGRGCRVSKLL